MDGEVKIEFPNEPVEIYNVVTRKYSTTDIIWPGGEWDNEPDIIFWIDRDPDRYCVALRNPQFGNWNGYVQIVDGCNDMKEDDVNVHGGITYSGELPLGDRAMYDHIYVNIGIMEPNTFVGFDCNHIYDFSPGFSVSPWTSMDMKSARAEGIYRNKEYIKKEIKKLSDQLYCPGCKEEKYDCPVHG